MSAYEGGADIGQPLTTVYECAPSFPTHRRRNNLSSSQESSPLESFCRLLGWLATSAGGDGAAVGAPKLNQPGSPSPGSGAGAWPDSAVRMKRLQISTGRPPPTACLVGVLSSLPSQMPATSREG